jgi:hypothetical protein
MPIEYLAGIVDGEGHIYRPKCKTGQGYPFFQSRIIVTNTSKPLMEAIRASFGGSYRVRTPCRTNNLVCYNWTLSGKEAEALARRLRPHLIVKAEQVLRIV